MKFSIIIPVRAVNDFLLENISSLQKLNHSSFEVIVLTDSTVDVLPVSDSRFKFVPCGPVGPGEKRNLGANMALGEYLAFLDDDAYPAPNWLTEVERVFEETKTYAVGGPAVTPLDAPPDEVISGKVLSSWLTSGGTIYRHKPTTQTLVNDYPSVNLTIKKEAFDKVGGFPLKFWPGEDTKICLDLVKEHGTNFVYDPRPLVYHHRRNVFVPHLKQISRYAMHRGRFAKIFPETSRLPSYFIPSAFVLGLFFGLISSFVHFIFLYIYLAVLSLYATLLCIESIKVYKEFGNAKICLKFALSVLLTHVVYGIYFITGFIKAPSFTLRGVDKKTGNYIGG